MKVKKLDMGFAVAGSVMTIVFIMIVNFITSPGYSWFIYPAFSVAFLIIGLYSMVNRLHKQLSISYSVLIITFLIVTNYLNTPDYPWFLYGVFPIIWWPILVHLGDRAGSMKVAVIGSSSIILYYVILNIFLAPGYLWAIYPAFAVLWWPLSIYHAGKRAYFEFSVHASLLITVFFITANLISTPTTIWAVYPIFVVLWWPLSMYYFVHKR